MGDKRTLSKARMELEELYLGIPDDSVNLTFQDLADVKQNPTSHKTLEKKKSNSTMEIIQESKTPRQGNSPLGSPIRRSSPKRLPSLDFSRGLQATNNNDRHVYDHHHIDHHKLHHDHVEDMRHGSSHGHHPHHHHMYGGHDGGHHHHQVHHGHGVRSMAYDHDDMSVMSMNSTYQDRGGSRPRRPGVPHSKICTICSTYIYIFRNRCLVCGRVYCRNCVGIGMGEMTEGRKCVQCLGKRFSQRYIQRAGETGCCFFSRYPSSVKQAEIKWAEKGPRRSGEMRGFGHSTTLMSRSRSPVAPRTSTLPHAASNPPSFVSSSPYSPYTPKHHHLPL